MTLDTLPAIAFLFICIRGTRANGAARGLNCLSTIKSGSARVVGTPARAPPSLQPTLYWFDDVQPA